MTERLVVGALIVDRWPHPTRLLAARRTDPPELAGRWEFPGGKVEPGETPEEALLREIAEELTVTVRLEIELLPPDARAWPLPGHRQLRTWWAVVTEGEPQLTDAHDELRWVDGRTIDLLDWLPADWAVVDAIRPSLLGVGGLS